MAIPGIELVGIVSVGVGEVGEYDGLEIILGKLPDVIGPAFLVAPPLIGEFLPGSVVGASPTSSVGKSDPPIFVYSLSRVLRSINVWICC